MKLDIKERLILSYLLKILEKLYPDEKSNFSSHRTAIEDGYELHYSWMTEHLSDGLSSAECIEVLDVLDMYSSFYFSFKGLAKPANLTMEKIKFPGFDGNNETMRMAYTQYFIEDLGRFKYIKDTTGGYYNSHAQMVPRYQRMLEKWNKFPIDKRNSLTEDQIIELLETY